jgi:hypothetical protein
MPAYEKLGFDEAGESGGEKYGNCPICRGHNKFYVNPVSGMYSCKAGRCGSQGNIYSFFKEWYAARLLEPPGEGVWDNLAANRGIRKETLKGAGLVYDGDNWYIPIRNAKGTLINFRYFGPDGKLWGMKGGFALGLYGAEELAGSDPDLPVFLCEGEWDRIACIQLLADAEVNAIAVATPGSNVLKPEWLELFEGKDVILVYDNDAAGEMAVKKAFKAIGTARRVRAVYWPPEFPPKFDLRDFVREGGTLDKLLGMVEPGRDEDMGPPAKETIKASELLKGWPALASGTRPTWEWLEDQYRSLLEFTPDMRDMLRVGGAVVLTAQLDGDPLWMHIAAPAGSGKSEVINSLAEVGNTIMRSTVTVHSLASGYQDKGQKDPSLLPLLYSKTFLLKDWTEILQMNVTQREEIYAIFRGAYDGRVEKSFGTGTLREYRGFFNMLTGVTHAIFGESQASLGERFLVLKVNHVPGAHNARQIRAALRNVGTETGMREKLQEYANAFFRYRIEPEDVPSLEERDLDFLINLAELVSILRATVTRDRGDRTRLMYRPQPEMGTRLAKQLAKLLLGLSLQRWPATVTDDDRRIVRRVALDSCAAWNLEVLHYLHRVPGGSVQSISKACNIPESTVRDQLDTLYWVGAVTRSLVQLQGKQGGGTYEYELSRQLTAYWEGAGMVEKPATVRRKVPGRKA